MSESIESDRQPESILPTATVRPSSPTLSSASSSDWAPRADISPGNTLYLKVKLSLIKFLFDKSKKSGKKSFKIFDHSTFPL